MRRVLPVVAIGLGSGAAPLVAQQRPGVARPVEASDARLDAQLDARTRALASQIRCPVCQGLSIQDSPSQLAQQMRDRVRQMLRGGVSPDEVKRYFVARYGVWVLMEPPTSGFDGLVYVLPIVALIGGGAVVIRTVRRWTAAPQGADAPPERDV